MIQDPTALALPASLNSLLADLDAELAAFQALGEFPPEVQDELQRAFLPERISDTLNIEGIRVNPRITRAILEGLTIAESDQYNEREILNVISANELIESESKAQAPMTLQLIRELHRRVEDGLIDSAGSLRQGDVAITGAIEQPPSWADVPDLLRSLCDSFQQADLVHPVVRAAWLHASFTRVHPFEDGNGRTGRLLQDFALLAAGLLPVGVPAARRQEYYDALESADRGDWQSLVEIVANSELTALDRARRIAEAPEKRRERVKLLLKAASNTVKQRDYNRYEVWRRRVEGVRDEFGRWAEELNADAEGLRIRVRVYDPISFDKWLEMRTKSRVSGTWVASLTFSVGRTPVYTFLLYARRHDFAAVQENRALDHGLVGVFLTGASEPEAKYSFGRYDDPYISLRELLFDGSEMLVYRDQNSAVPQPELPDGVQVSPHNEKWALDDSATLADVVEEFFGDALRKLGLIS